MSKVTEFIAKEIREVIPPTILFFFVFSLMAITEMLILDAYSITLAGVLSVTVGALIVAKAVLIAEALPFIDLFKNKPLIITAIWKSILYLIFCMLFRYLEEVIPLVSQYGGFVNATKEFFDEKTLQHIVASLIWAFALLFMYCAMAEIIKLIGAEKVKKAFFTPRS